MTNLKNKPEVKETYKDRGIEARKNKVVYHNCVAKDHYANNFTETKEKIYEIDEGSEEEPVGKRSDSDRIRNGIREDPQSESQQIEAYIMECNEENSLDIQDIELNSGMPQVTSEKELCKHTLDEQTFLVKTKKGMGFIHGTPTKLTVHIERFSKSMIIDKGDSFSIVEKKYLREKFLKWDEELLPKEKETSKLHQEEFIPW
ncbi:hypothetical protein O181_049074 [Austropuccinia psidii MF-1]|uniref:Uncharacterized protein n=1 Tax=Austropuccinia psidii MF-1 TaxID=1389203 RepID=A0A9Q3DU36_9BASI|nr:hypothetical protein [Austropuccinia psidii MF-1]